MATKAEVAKKATFTTDDKRAQYARLVAFNHAVKAKLVKKSEANVNTVSDAILTKAVNELADGNMLEGKGGIELITALSKDGAEDEKVAKRGLTTAYAQEVRPFLRRKMLAAKFGRRSTPRKPKEKAEGKKAEAKKGAAPKKSSNAKKSAVKEEPEAAAPPAEEEEGAEQTAA